MIATSLQKTRQNLGYSVGVLGNEELTIARTSNIANALSGKIPGVRVTGTKVWPAAVPPFLSGGLIRLPEITSPYLFDEISIDNGGGSNALQSGVTLSNRAIDLNQDDIESITVLKGPGATVLYGSRAASGAIIMTSRKGRKNQDISIEFNSTTQFVNVDRYPDYQNKYAQGASANNNPPTLIPSEYSKFNALSSSTGVLKLRDNK